MNSDSQQHGGASLPVARGYAALLAERFKGLACAYRMEANLAKNNPTLASWFDAKAQAYDSAARIAERETQHNDKLTDRGANNQ